MDEKETPKPFKGLEGLSKEEVLELIGDPREINRSLAIFSKSTRLVADHYSELMERYPDEWIAVYNGRVRAHGKSFQAVLDEVDAKGLPRAQTLLRFMNTKPQTLIV